MHDVWPVETWYWPTTHDVHTVAPAAEKEPAKQFEQLAIAMAPVVPNEVPAGQLLQLNEPAIA